MKDDGQYVDPAMLGSREKPGENLCKKCGQPTHTLALICLMCLGRQYQKELEERKLGDFDD